MTRRAYYPHSVIGGFAIVALMSSTALAPTKALGQTQQAQVLTCVQIVLPKNDKGKAVVKISDSVISQTASGTGEVILEIDPKCLGQTPASPDKYDEARKAVDTAVEQSGLPPEKKEEAKKRLNSTIDQAQKDNQDPVKDLETANENNAAAGEKPGGDKDTAMLAAIGAVAVACTVASAGVCSAVALAILPSLLPPDISNKDIAGVVRVVQGAAQGSPISPDDAAVLQRILNQNAGKLEAQAQQQLEKFVQNGSAALKAKVAKELMIDAAKVDAGAKFLREAVLTGQFNCKGLKEAMGMTQTIRLSREQRDSIIETLLTHATVMRNSDRISAEARKCLAQVIVFS